MVTRRTHGDLLWVDVVQPTPEEVRQLMEEFALDPLIADELIVPSARNRVNGRDEYFYVVLHFPAFKHLHSVAGRSVELDFIVGKNWIITTRYDDIDPLHQFSTLFEVDTVLDKKNMSEHAGYIFFYMLSELYKTLNDELAHIGDRLDAAEEHVFEGYEREMVAELSHISRDLLNYGQALNSHEMMLQSLEAPGVALFGYTYARNIRSIIGEYDRLSGAMIAHRAALDELRQTNDSLLTTKQNEIMKLFTIMAFVTFPLTLFTSVFGMNTKIMPIVGHQWDFWIIIGIMVSAATAFFAFFKYKKWL
jgi:magnesium transporter